MLTLGEFIRLARSRGVLCELTELGGLPYLLISSGAIVPLQTIDLHEELNPTVLRLLCIASRLDVIDFGLDPLPELE